MSKNDIVELKTNNKKIVTFYNEHPSIDFEKANLLLINFLDSIVNHVTNDLDGNINSQILSYMQSSKKDFDILKQNVNTISESMSKITSETVENINSELNQVKRDYVEQMKNIITADSLTANEKITNFIEKNNASLLDRTTLVLNDVIPKTQDVYQCRVRETIENKIQLLHQQICEDTSNIINSSSNFSIGSKPVILISISPWGLFLSFRVKPDKLISFKAKS